MLTRIYNFFLFLWSTNANHIFAKWKIFCATHCGSNVFHDVQKGCVLTPQSQFGWSVCNFVLNRICVSQCVTIYWLYVQFHRSKIKWILIIKSNVLPHSEDSWTKFHFQSTDPIDVDVYQKSMWNNFYFLRDDYISQIYGALIKT